MTVAMVIPAFNCGRTEGSASVGAFVQAEPRLVNHIGVEGIKRHEGKIEGTVVYSLRVSYQLPGVPFVGRAV